MFVDFTNRVQAYMDRIIVAKSLDRKQRAAFVKYVRKALRREKQDFEEGIAAGRRCLQHFLQAVQSAKSKGQKFEFEAFPADLVLGEDFQAVFENSHDRWVERWIRRGEGAAMLCS